MNKLTSTLILSVIMGTTAFAAPVTDPTTGKQYLLSDQALSWNAAVTFAEQAGGHLFTPDNLAELNFVRTAFGRTELFWIGFEEYQGQWVNQHDGSLPLFTYWGSFVPTAGFGLGAVFNWPTSQGFTRGGFGEIDRKIQLRAIIEFEPQPSTNKAYKGIGVGGAPFLRKSLRQ